MFKRGTAQHANNVALGKHGRNRTNIWSYPGVGGFGRRGRKALKLHPTVKPVALVAEALLDVTAPGSVVLDPFGGSGSTMIAAERLGRRARLVEYDPVYVDRIIARWEQMTGKEAVLIDRESEKVSNESEEGEGLWAGTTIALTKSARANRPISTNSRKGSRAIPAAPASA